MISGKGDDGDGNASLISGASGNGKKAHHFHAWLYVDKQDNSPGLLASIAKHGRAKKYFPGGWQKFVFQVMKGW